MARAALGDDVVDHYVNNGQDRAGRLRRGRHRLGEVPGVRTLDEHRLRRDQPCDGAGRPHGRAVRRPSRPTPRSNGAAQALSRPGVRSRRPTAARLLRRFAEAVDADLEHLARLEVANAGHTIGNARWEAGNARDVLQFFSAAPERLYGRQIPVAGGVDVTFKEPLGVVGIIVPWNFPMPIAAWGFAPALAAGNTVVLKPAEYTPLTAHAAGRAGAARPASRQACLPGAARRRGRGGPTVRRRTRPSARWCSPGRRAVGKRVMRGCADQVKRVTLELGGKSANIVFADADLERAAATAPYAVFDNAGQDCCARSRILVERSAYDRFMELLEPAVHGRQGARPADDPASEMGPLISAGAARAGLGLRARRRAGRVSRHGPRRARVLVPANGSRPGRPPAPRWPSRRSSARSSRSSRSTTRPMQCASPTTATYGLSGSIWTTGRRPGAAGQPRARVGQPVGQLPFFGALLHPVRRLQAVGAGTRAGARCPRLVHRRQERLHRHGGLSGRQVGRTGRGHHRRGQRHRARDRTAVRVRRAPRSSSPTSTDEAGSGRGRQRWAASTSGPTSPTRTPCRRCTQAAIRTSVASTSASTTPASRRPTTTRSSRPASTRGAGCRRSTSPASTCAASTASRTCSSAARARSSTRRRSSR